jgi:putative Ca2+/H+ antiporter (TMEM165/GDT1 family)
MHDFWVSLAMIFVAELGDKTQLVSLALATRFNARVVLSGIFVATLLVHVFSAALGNLAGAMLPTAWVQFLSGLAFIAFGFWTLRGDTLDDDPAHQRHPRSPFLLVVTVFFLAELGDKTMLSTVTLASTGAFVPVWLGSTVGMVISDGLAIAVGRVMGTRLPERTIKVGAALIFFAFGLWAAVSGGMSLHPVVWGLGCVAVAVPAFLFLVRRKGLAENQEIDPRPIIQQDGQ